MQIIKNLVIIIGLVLVLAAWKYCSKKVEQHAVKRERTLFQKPVTIFVHGTLPPIADRLVHRYDIPLGLHKAQELKSSLIMGKIPYILSEANPLHFPLSEFYMFGWSGDLNFAAREKAAQTLYKAIKALGITGPITLIGHSHGCNVILNLAAVAKETHDESFTIERAILLAGPVQRTTAVFIHSDVFKKIYSFYSTTDLLQVLDPQGLYKECKHLEDITLFSHHIFAHHEKLVQIQVKKGKRGIWHTEFIMKDFIQKLPRILQLLNEKTPLHEGIYSFTVNLKNLALHKG